MKLRLIRHATVLLTYGGQRILIDPMLSSAGMNHPIPTRGVGKDQRNPTAELPMDAIELQALVNSLDAVLLTHTHDDHWDDAAKALLPKDISVLCQVEDADGLRKHGYENIVPIASNARWSTMEINRTPAHHGGFIIRRKMGVTSGFILQAQGEPTLYIPGDTIWCKPVKDALQKFKPDAVILYAGAAQLPFGRSITMNAQDITKVCHTAPSASIIAVHMEAINHCLLTREALRQRLKEKGLDTRVQIPKDGETMDFQTMP